VPRWPDEPIKSGRLEEPKFVHGFDPEAHKWQPPPRPSPWKRHFELGRQNPAVWNPATQKYEGGWMLVAVVKKGGPRARRNRIEDDRHAIQAYSNLHWPLERWQVRSVTLSGTWCDMELYLRFLGTLTPEEDALDRKQRREAYQARLAKTAEKKRRLAQEAREKAAREELEARVKIRGRGRTGR
jgi:hypothetical protein